MGMKKIVRQRVGSQLMEYGTTLMQVVRCIPDGY